MKINEWKLYKKEEDIIEENENEKINENSDFHKINLNNIFSSNSIKEHVLCVGQVQSGKTKNIENAIDFAVKNKYKLIIIFSGITKILFNQTNKRINNYEMSKGVKFIEFIKNANLHASLENNETVILSILKSNDSLRLVFDEVDLINWTNHKVLIIDDECDYASINISGNQTSRIHNLISKLYNRFYNVKFLSFTGTPFGNIMSSNNKNLQIDRVVTLLNYKSYCGIKFFNENANYNYVPLLLSKNDKLEDRHFYGIFWYWLVQTACSLIENNEFKSELIINIEIENTNQSKIFSSLKDAYLEICKDIQKKDSKKRIDYVIEKLKLEKQNTDLIKEKIIFILKEIYNNPEKSFILLNSESDDSVNFKSGMVQFCVIVGGFMISRGFTFENLTTEFFLNVPKEKITIDTLLQRCRWFGNRTKENRNKFLRIVVNKEILEALKSAQEYVEIFVPGTSTTNIGEIYKKINTLDKLNKNVESTNATKRK